MAPDAPSILFTGFEPSGDDHASAVIRELKAAHPSVRVYAWGGKKMEAAGAEIVEYTGQNAVMGIPGLGKILEHRAINKRVAAWLDGHPVAVHVPVDSPAANFPICKIAKRRGAKVVHLVAPQVWAWGTWRINKLRRLTDFVCCLLPFEESYFKQRRVPAKFVGHPLFDELPDPSVLDGAVAGFPEGGARGNGEEWGRKIALMPGSRPKEIERNFPLLIEAFRRLRRDYPDLTGVVAATHAGLEPRLREIARRTPTAPGSGDRCTDGWPDGVVIAPEATDAVTRWCDLALVVSGTVTLQIARQGKPMVIVYKSSRLMYWAIAKWLLSTPFFSLPNLIAGERVVPELIPHFGGPERIVDEAVALLERPERGAQQSAALREITEKYRGTHAARGAAAVIAKVAGLVGQDAGSSPVASAASSAS